jgi:hypothetical protein
LDLGVPILGVVLGSQSNLSGLRPPSSKLQTVIFYTTPIKEVLFFLEESMTYTPSLSTIN